MAAFYQAWIVPVNVTSPEWCLYMPFVLGYTGKKGGIPVPSTKPIGFFDSGAGGLSVVKTARRLLPLEDICYYGDSANAPYGIKKPEEIQVLTRAGVQILLDQGVKALVLACNTASGVALAALQAELDIPVLGIQPALEAAQQLRRKGEILVLATPATFKTVRYAALKAQFGRHTLDLPAPGLMEFVERLELEGPGLEAFLRALFKPCQGKAIDVVVLGCTHYPFLSAAIQPFFPDAALIDDSPQVAAQLREQLQALDLLTPNTQPGNLRLFSSGGERAVALMRRLLPDFSDTGMCPD
jgi:glutamate racemase